MIGAGRAGGRCVTRWIIIAATIVLHGCGMLGTTTPPRPDVTPPEASTQIDVAMPPASPLSAPAAAAARPPVGLRLTEPRPGATLAKPSRRAGASERRYFADDGPGALPPEALLEVPEPTPRHEPLADFANRNYVVFGKAYTPQTARTAQKQRGVASWYGRKFHGRPTATGEKYDMYAMTAAHPTLPLPSYVRVTNLETKRSVVVRVNDRGPFLNGRLIDVSYAAAAKLGFAHKGSTRVEIETIVPATTLASGLLVRN